MKTFEEIAIAHGACHCISAYSGRNLIDPSCEVHDLELVAQEYAEQFKPKWIDVNERLPEEDGEYLTLAKQFNNSQQVVRFHRGCWSMWNQETTHWMPLPEPPKH